MTADDESDWMMTIAPTFHPQQQRSQSMKKLLNKTTVAVGFVLLAMNSHAEQGGAGMTTDMGNMKMDSMEMEPSNGMSLAMNEGVVREMDKANSLITLKHGPIKSKTVEMGPMIMTFHVQKPSLLSKVKVGDRVKFTLENVKDKATVTALQVQK